MKKTLSVNLGGIVYHIDEDAYSELTDYLQKLKQHLGNEDSSEEVLNDIEQRISELFTQWMEQRRQVVTLTDVQKVISILGHPEQFEDTKSDAADESPNEKKTEFTRGKTDGPYRRLYRDPSDALLGGVCSGLAHYLKVSPLLLRLLVFLLTCYWGVGVLVYIVFWIIVPEARTAAQRLEMQGEDVTIDNIEKKVREEYEKVKDRVDGYVGSDKYKQNIRTVETGFTRFIHVFAKILLTILASIFLFIGLGLLAFLVVTIVAIWSGSSLFLLPFLHDLAPLQQFCVNPVSATLVPVGLFLVVGIPFIAMFRLLFRGLLNLKPARSWEIWVGLVFWLVGIALCVYSSLAVVQTAGELWI